MFARFGDDLVSVPDDFPGWYELEQEALELVLEERLKNFADLPVHGGYWCSHCGTLMPATRKGGCSECGHEHGMPGSSLTGPFSREAYEQNDMWVTPEAFAALGVDEAGDLPLFRSGHMKKDKGWMIRMRHQPMDGFFENQKAWNVRPPHFPDGSEGARMEAYGLESELVMFGSFNAWARWLSSNVKTCREVVCKSGRSGPVHKCAFKHCPRRAHLACSESTFCAFHAPGDLSLGARSPTVRSTLETSKAAEMIVAERYYVCSFGGLTRRVGEECSFCVGKRHIFDPQAHVWIHRTRLELEMVARCGNVDEVECNFVNFYGGYLDGLEVPLEESELNEAKIIGRVRSDPAYKGQAEATPALEAKHEEHTTTPSAGARSKAKEARKRKATELSTTSKTKKQRRTQLLDTVSEPTSAPRVSKIKPSPAPMRKPTPAPTPSSTLALRTPTPSMTPPVEAGAETEQGDDRVEELERQLSKANETTATLDHELQESREQLATLRSALSSPSGGATDRESELSAAKAEVATLREDLASARAKAAESEAALVELRSQNLSTAMETESEELVTLRRKVASLEAEVSRLTTACAASESSLANFNFMKYDNEMLTRTAAENKKLVATKEAEWRERETELAAELRRVNSELAVALRRREEAASSSPVAAASESSSSSASLSSTPTPLSPSVVPAPWRPSAVVIDATLANEIGFGVVNGQPDQQRRLYFDARARSWLRQAESYVDDLQSPLSITRLRPRLFWACYNGVCQGVSAEGDAECATCHQETRPAFARWPLHMANSIAYAAPWEKREFLRHVNYVCTEHEEREVAQRVQPGALPPTPTLPMTPRSMAPPAAPRQFAPSELPAPPPRRPSRQEQVVSRPRQPTGGRSSKSPSPSRSPSPSPSQGGSRSDSALPRRLVRRRNRQLAHSARRSRSPGAHRSGLFSSSSSSAPFARPPSPPATPPPDNLRRREQSSPPSHSRSSTSSSSRARTQSRDDQIRPPPPDRSSSQR